MKKSKLKAALRVCRRSFIYVAIFSCFVNLLMLTTSLYMLQVFDRVLPGFSNDTLIYLTILAVFALLIMSLLDAARMKILHRVSHWLDNALSPLALVKSVDESLHESTYGQESLRDLEKIRQFICGMDVLALFDAPWTVVYLLVIYLLHPLLGLVATLGVVSLVVISFFSELSTRKLVVETGEEHMLSQSLVNSTIHCSESIRAMGMVERAVRRWYLQKQKQIIKQDKMTHYSTFFTTTAKFFRMVLQISILGVGAALVVRYSSGQAVGVFTAGGMIAASILTARAMAPVEKLIGTWKRFLEVRQSLKRIHHFMDASTDVVKSTLMTDLSGALFLDNVIYRPKPGADPIIKGVNLRIDAGDVVAIIGPSGAGKSTLARLMLGIWRPDHGAVMMDGYDLSQCQRKDIGARIGYCPQRVQLISASVKDNIARLSDACDEDIVAAAKMVGAHTMIQSLAEGYQTLVRPYIMSGGQQQRVGLAQAFYGDPCFVVLDEPDSNLDDEGVRSLGMALQQAKQKGTTIVLVTHRASYLRWVDKVVVMADGTVQAYGPAEQIMQRLQQSNTTPPPNYKPSH